MGDVLEVDPNDRIGPRGSGGLFALAPVLFVAAVAAIALVAVLGSNVDGALVALGLAKRADYTAVYRALDVAPLEPSQETGATVAPNLKRLARERCDGRAVSTLAEVVAKSGDDRWAAKALIGWSAACGPDNLVQQRRATDLLLQIHDYAAAAEIAARLVDAHPGTADYWYLQAKADVGLHKPEAALLGFANTIHLSAAPGRVGAWVFYEMSDLYAAEHRYCEAIGPIEDYVSIDPGSRGPGKAQRLIETYASQGHCPAFASGSASLPIAGGNVVHVRASIDGVTGTFVVDTGASFVTVDAGFAAKAHLAPPAAGAKLRSETANGAVYTRLATATLLKVGGVQAHQVPVAILDKPLGTGVDGLLGRSFLSRFDVTMGATTLTMKPR